MSVIQNLQLSVRKLGISGTLALLAQKRAKKNRLKKLLTIPPLAVTLRNNDADTLTISDKEHTSIIERADEMLGDENYFFTFIHQLRGIEDPWNYDPIEKKYWPKHRYEETKVHSAATPRDVKIIWEINRFKYLPLLAEAAYLTKDKKYAVEIKWRILSWIDGNPFAGTINWSSPLEVAIRAISWTAALRILSLAEFDISADEKIATSLWQHAAYLNAELSTDKIVRSNHLIGEASGLYILSSYFDFPQAPFYRLRAKKILSDSIMKQTNADGASREASGWYHTFVSDFLDLAIRTGHSFEDSFDAELIGRFEQIQIYRNSIILPDGDPVRYGDCDFGKAINLSLHWKDLVFGPNIYLTTEKNCYFENSQHLTMRMDKNYLFVRAGAFGWGGDGFSSHAHDDFLSPVLALDSVNILVDPGTYVYNGSPVDRDNERDVHSHNGLVIGGNSGAISKPSFGWAKTRPNARIDFFSWNEDKIVAEASYGEWQGQYSRHFSLLAGKCIIEDRLDFKTDQSLEWNFHLHPRWRIEKLSPSKFALRDFRNYHYEFELSGIEAELEVLPYDFAPSYMSKTPAKKIRLRTEYSISGGKKEVTFVISKRTAD